MDSNFNIPSERILVVEDEPFQRRILASVLKSNGFRGICEAGSGSAAIAILGTELINIVVSDIDMPELNGLELLRQIRSGQTPARRDIGFIVLTSHSNTEVLGAAMALDVNGFIVKPFTSRVLLEKIERTGSESMSLRSESEYASVITDLTSLRKERLFGGSGNESGGANPHAIAGRVTIPIPELRVGMRMANNLTAVDGTIIIAAETTLTKPLIHVVTDLKELAASGVVTVYEGWDGSTE